LIIFILAAIMCALSAITYKQTTIWKNSITLWSYVLEKQEEFGAKEKREYKVVIRDIWHIELAEIDNIKTLTEKLLNFFPETEYEQYANQVGEHIYQMLAEIELSQAEVEASESIKERQVAFEENKDRMDSTKRKLKDLQDLLLSLPIMKKAKEGTTGARSGLHVGMFKAANNYDIYDPQTGEIIMECREDSLGVLTKLFRFTDYKRMTPFDIQIRTPDGRQVVHITRGVSLFLSKVSVLDEHDRAIGGFKQKFFSIGMNIFLKQCHFQNRLKGAFQPFEHLPDGSPKVFVHGNGMDIPQVNIPLGPGSFARLIQNHMIIIKTDGSGQHGPQGQFPGHMDHGPVELLFEKSGLGSSRAFQGRIPEIIVPGLLDIHQKKSNPGFKFFPGQGFNLPQFSL